MGFMSSDGAIVARSGAGSILWLGCASARQKVDGLAVE
jgi:hypothetical protein